MGSTVFPAASAASKTRYVVTLLTGTSWTVPAGCLYVNAKLIGGGGGGGCGSTGAINNRSVDGHDGQGAQIVVSNLVTTPTNTIAYSIGAGGIAGDTSATPNGGVGGTTTFTGATSATGGQGGKAVGGTLTGTDGESANNGAQGGGYYNAVGGVGGTGKIEIEYWA